MNIRILLLLPILLGFSINSWAAPGECSGPKEDRPDQCGGGGQPNNDTTDCKIDFSVEFTPSNVILSDGKGAYPDPADSKDKSGGGTHSGPGFRFDTNGTQRLETARDTRWLEINPVPVPDFGGMNNFEHFSGADFRFHLPAGGLDLCSLDKNGSGDVPMILAFVDDGGTQWALLYDCIFHDTAPIKDSTKGDGSRVKVTVTRNKGDAGGWTKGDTWTITGTDACLISSDNYATSTPVLQAANLSADFEMTIEAQ